MRVFVLPVYRNYWALYSHSSSRSTSRLSRWVAKASGKWESLKEAPPASWKHRIYSGGTKLMDKMDHREYFLKSVPAKAEAFPAIDSVTILYPSADVTGSHVSHGNSDGNRINIGRRRIPYHTRWMWLSLLCLPLSATFSVVPVLPNLPLFYNLYRLYSHHKARAGALHLQHLLDIGAIQFETSAAIDARYRGDSVRINMENAADAEENDKYGRLLIKREQVVSLGTDLEIPGMELGLARSWDQITAVVAAKRKAWSSTPSSKSPPPPPPPSHNAGNSQSDSAVGMTSDESDTTPLLNKNNNSSSTR
ncbi:hypothetical protein GQ42DRAFT_150515 [Ramicandelaber brevisporus]|nr:hypothetical protein GQ42DRAFT_150515 [Ramicandelaber brevisporus]